MAFFELFLIAVGLSMDAFAVALCKGVAARGQRKLRPMLITGAYFGGFQALMPAIGFGLGIRFQTLIMQIDHWIACILLVLIGGNMIRESRSLDIEPLSSSFTAAAMLPFAVATSIDALAIGVTFACLRVALLPAICLIGATTFICSCVGVYIGQIFGAAHQAYAAQCGGIVLILMGGKILLDHLGFFL